MTRITFITDTWMDHNSNGVVVWIRNMTEQLEKRGFVVSVIHPGLFRGLPMPTYPELQVSICSSRKMARLIRSQSPDYIHIATEGSLGFSAHRACRRNGWKFSTFYHTRLPEYLHVRFKTLKGLTYKYLRWFHNTSPVTYVGTESIGQLLHENGFKNIVTIPLGIDHTLFKRNEKAIVPKGLNRPVFMYLGRLAPEKNIEAFLKCKTPGSKLVVGDGPSREALESEYGESALFVGRKSKEEVVDLLSISDVLAFPSKTDTFGLVIVEALACGVPVAGYDVSGPRDIITHGVDGITGDDLQKSLVECLKIDSKKCIEKAKQFTWEHTADLFVESLLSHQETAGI